MLREPPHSYEGEAKMGSAAQQYCLRWNNHRSNLLTVFDQLLQNEAFTDVTLACEGASIKCHRMVLAACSSYFRSLFTDLSCRHLVVVLKDVGYPEIKAILEYMYRGEVNVAQDQLAALLRVAETLKVKGLVEENVRTDSPPPSHHSPPSTSTVTTSVSSVPPNLSPPRAAGMTSVSHAHTYVPSPPSPQPPGMPGSSSMDRSGQRPVALSPWALPPGAHRSQHHPHHVHPMQSHHHAHSLIQHGTLPPPSTHHHHPCPPMPPSSSHHLQQPEGITRDEAGDLSSSPKRRRPSGGGDGGAIQRFPSPPPPQRRDTPILRTVLGQSHSHHQGMGMQRPVALLSGHSSHREHGDGGSDGADSSQPAQRPVSLVCRHGSGASPDRESSNGSASESVRIMKYEQSYDDDHSPYTNISNADDEAYNDKKNVMMLPGSTQPTFSGEMKGISSGIATYVPTQKPEWKRYKQYTRSDIMSAIEAVRTGMSALQAARKYGVPSRTLYDKVKKLGITTSRPFKRSSAPMSHHQGGNSNESLSKSTTPTPPPSSQQSQQPPPSTTPNSSPNEGDPETPPGGGHEGSGDGGSPVDGGMDESHSPQLHRMSSHPHLHFAHAPSHHAQQRHSSTPPPTPNTTNATSSRPPSHHHPSRTPPMEVVNDVPEPRGSVVTAVPRHVEDGDMNDVGRPISREGVGPSCMSSPPPGAYHSGDIKGENEEEEGEEGGEDEVEDLSVGNRHREVGSVVAFVPGETRREGVVVKAERMEEGRVGGPGGKNEEVLD
ncbi:protein bric-a-brac 1-like isoform X2 [Ischnura elegans]|uniref:protein bric-a-brac 1-like isoform X2 n=1 Tax=Ischnura elegans TaxID=197161 RepID=UPI001ED8B730|nr:protein bric-a-brac 1-like isoform X2 [Ischnura elegans]